eukprot:Gb_40983 [translate_table: standard]
MRRSNVRVRVREGMRSLSPNRDNSRSFVKREEPGKSFFYRREGLPEPHRRHSIDRRDEVRKSPVLVRRTFAEPQERRSQSDRGNSRKYSPSRNGDEGSRRKYFASESIDRNPNKAANDAVDKAGNNVFVRNAPDSFDRNPNKDFASGSGSGTVLDGYGMLVQKSIMLEDGTVRTFFTLPPVTADPLSEPKPYSTNEYGSKTGVSNRIGNADFSFPGSVATQYSQDPRYLQSKSPSKLHSSRSAPREPYDGEEKEKYYSRAALYSAGPPQSKSLAVDTASSRLSKDADFGGYRDSLHTVSENFTSRGRLLHPPTSEERRQREVYSRNSDSIIFAEDFVDEGLQSRSGRRMRGSPSRSDAYAGAYTEIPRVDRPVSTFMSDKTYNKGRRSPYRDYAPSAEGEVSSQYGSSVRSYLGNRLSDRMEDTGSVRRELREGAHKDGPMQRDPVDRYGNMHRISSPSPISSDVHGEPLLSRRSRLSAVSRMVESRSPPIRRLREEYPNRKERHLMDRMEKSRSPLRLSAMSPYRSNLSPRSRSHMPFQELDLHGPVDRVLKRKYIGEENHRGDMRSSLPNDQDKFRKLRKLDFNDDEWRDQERAPRYRMHPGRSFGGESSHRASDSRSLPEDKSLHMQGHIPDSWMSRSRIGGPSKWTRQNLRYDDNSVQEVEEERGYHRPYKFQKYSSVVDEQGRSSKRHNVKEDDLLDNREPVRQPDLPEDSEVFKQQVHKAYLRFSKLLNENPGQQKQYEDQGKSGSLLCVVCSRFSKDFVDTHSLVMHAFNSQKVGLRAEHLGLHKALCVLMGWNHAPPPDNARAYQSLPSPEATAMKEDLILWPPLVIIHNGSIGKKKDGCQEVISNVEVDEILRGLGFGSGKSKAVSGRDAHEGTVVVKFLPTFSGLQEAERLHKYYEDNHCGRKDWLKIQTSEKQNVDEDIIEIDGHAEDKKKVLYGYIGIAGDLEKVDSDTRRRTLVKSRKDIEAIADGPIVGV